MKPTKCHKQGHQLLIPPPNMVDKALTKTAIPCKRCGEYVKVKIWKINNLGEEIVEYRECFDDLGI